MQPRKRVLLVSYDFPPMVGGVSVCAWNIARSLQEQDGVSVRVLAPRHPGWREFDRRLPFTVVRVPFCLRPRFAAVAFGARVLWELFAWKPTSVLNMFWFPDGLATFGATRLRRIPYFLFAHGVEVLESERSVWKLLRKRLSFLKRIVFRRSAGTFAVSDFTRGLVEGRCDVPAAKVRVVHNGVDCREFFPTAKPVGLACRFSAGGRFVFASVCRLCDYKGVDQVIQAVHRLRREFPEILYLVGGNGPDRTRLERLIRHYDLSEHVRLIGNVRPEELNAFYNLADCFVMPSRDDWTAPNVEGFGIVYLEAAACGKPVIAGRSGGIADAVEHGRSGWLVDPGDVGMLAFYMDRLLRDPAQGIALGNYGRARAASRFTWQAAARGVVEGMEQHVRN